MKTFGNFDPRSIVAEDDLFTLIWDKYPVSPGHLLIVVKRPVARFQELTDNERSRLMHWMAWSTDHLYSTLQPKPDGINFGLNDGEAAGQTVGQLHFHMIPRYRGDAPDPRGGVRFVLPERARYW
ncbi:HIT family protein [Ramlibacter rhizophilus]|uniref:HIT family protein n=1 Tax=Ramlibacter rhizophilus TaxID=1781167 RepID=A0A4Z0BZI3_9BURK|nr:HIT family protein [Ramlibacter rhizophilus]TFZ03369.1 HIT family protein [Ramlibacter rhizophilus]